VRRRHVDLAELVDEPWMLPPVDTDVSPCIEEKFRANGLEMPRASVLCSSMHMNHALLASGRYLAIYPGSLLRFSEMWLSVKVLPVKSSITSTPFGIITLKDRMLNHPQGPDAEPRTAVHRLRTRHHADIGQDRATRRSQMKGRRICRRVPPITIAFAPG
jgi:DNA-binding transcriptional LysR family regulator